MMTDDDILEMLPRRHADLPIKDITNRMDNLIICAFITMLFHYCDAEIVEVWKPQRTRGSGGFAEVITMFTLFSRIVSLSLSTANRSGVFRL